MSYLGDTSVFSELAKPLPVGEALILRGGGCRQIYCPAFA